MTAVKIGRAPLHFEAGEVVVITGGARGVTAEAALALARTTKATLVLIGRSAAPQVEPQWLSGVESEADIKKALAAEAVRLGQKPNPKAIGAEYRKLAAAREITRTLGAIGAHTRVVYRSADMRDAEAIGVILREVRSSLGPVRGIVHGAGLLEDKLIDDKTPEQFGAVVDTKIAGLRALLEACQGDELRVLALFSSISGRLGRRGQVDYAMANEVLNKVARREAARRPSCRVVAINWGPWDGGMVGPGLSREFAKEGVPLIPMQAGAEAFVTELSAANSAAVEVIMGGPLKTQAGLAVALEHQLNVARNPFLKSHVLAGRPVLPLAMTMEWLARGALHANPKMTFHGFKDLRVLRGLSFETESVAISVHVGAAEVVEGHHELAVELRSGSANLHAKAIAILTTRMPLAPSRGPAKRIEGHYDLSVESAYNEMLFHGVHFRGIQEVLGISAHGISARVKAAPIPESWTADLPQTTWIADPLVVDAGFQLAILWCQKRLGAPSLPARLGSYRQFRDFPREEVLVTFLPQESSPLKVTGDILISAMGGDTIALIEDYECTVDARLTKAFKRQSSPQLSTI